MKEENSALVHLIRVSKGIHLGLLVKRIKFICDEGWREGMERRECESWQNISVTGLRKTSNNSTFAALLPAGDDEVNFI